MATPGHADSQRVRSIEHPRALAVCVVAAAATWEVFVWSANWQEQVVGVLCVAATVAFVFSVARTLGVDLTIRARDLFQAWRIPWYLLTGNWEITRVLLKDLLGIATAENRYRVCGFDSSRHDPVRIARTVMAVAYTTAAPNFIVIGIDPAQSRMLFHQIAATDMQQMAKALGAKG